MEVICAVCKPMTDGSPIYVIVQEQSIDLPARRIKGNSHTSMVDDTGDDIASLVLDWLKQRKLID